MLNKSQLFRTNRRSFFAILGATLLSVSAFRWFAHPQSSKPTGNFNAWIDTLVPAESNFPGAVALGVAQRIATIISQEPKYQELYQLATQWMDEQAQSMGQPSFATCSSAERQAIVSRAEGSPAGSMPRIFFQATLDDTLFHTYADPRAWVGLGYNGPPQPTGHLDHASPPTKR